MKTHITEIEVDFTSEEKDAIRKVYGVIDTNPPLNHTGEIRRVNELESILESVNESLQEDLENDERIMILRLRKELQITLEGIDNLKK